MRDARPRTRLFALLIPLLIVAGICVAGLPRNAGASSHREAPLIASDPDADNTDVYAFISPDRPDTVTLIANYIPLEHPEGGPNYHKFGDNVLYEIHIDNVGDAKSHVKYQFEFTTRIRNPATFLYNTGPINSLTDADWNISQVYRVTEVVQQGSAAPVSTVLASDVPSPPVNIGPKSTPNYAALASAAVRTIGSGAQAINVFAGPRDDGFFVDLGSVFDLLSLRGQAPPVGYASPARNIPLDGVSGYNTHSIVLQVPISRLTAPGEPVLGVWATASRRTTRVLTGVAGVLAGTGAETYSGDYVQISRLGMPLVNEAVIPLALKDAFNNLKPEQDFDIYTSGTPVGNLLKQSVLDPELQRLLKALYNVPNPGTNRLDIQAIFLTGMKTTKPFTITTPGGQVTLPPGTNVNQPASVRPAEMLRLNTAAPFRPGVTGSLCSPTPNYELGLLGGDACGFPNGRRLQDDVTDIELLAVGGAAYSVLTDSSFTFDPALVKVLRDNVFTNDLPFMPSFPYLAMPWSGQDHYHQQVTTLQLPWIPNNTRIPAD